MLWEKIMKIEKQMKLSDAPLALTFDDVSLVPVHSTIKSRKEPDVSTSVAGMKLKIPIIASPMNTISEGAMAQVMNEIGAGCVVHRYMPAVRQVEIYKRLTGWEGIWFAIGATGDYLERARMLYEARVKHFCIDVASGHSQTLLDAVESLRRAFPDISVMAGNVTSYDGAYNLASYGVNAIRIGIGSGSACKTRVVTGFGVPLLSTLEECWELKKIYPQISLIADGGCRSSGDMVKALCFSDAVMTGRLLAGTDETPGEIKNYESNAIYNQDRCGKFKKYAGMASKEGREFNGWFSEESSSYVPEGISTEVPYQGPVSKVIENLVGGIKVGMSYANARTLEELRKNAKFVRITNAGYAEGLPRT